MLLGAQTYPTPSPLESLEATGPPTTYELSGAAGPPWRGSAGNPELPDASGDAISPVVAFERGETDSLGTADFREVTADVDGLPEDASIPTLGFASPAREWTAEMSPTPDPLARRAG